MSEILSHVVASIAPASAAHAEAARRTVAGAGAPLLERLAGILGGAQHTPRPRVARRTIVVCAAGGTRRTALAAAAIADGTAALAHVARTSRTPIVVVDAGVVERAAMPAIAIELEARDEAQGLDAGIALAVSLADGGLDVLGIGALGDPTEGATALLAGLVLGAASMNIPTILDGEATGAAARVAARLAPAVTGYLVAAHRGSGSHPEILEQLGLVPIFDVGLGHGEGTGAAMVLPLADQVAALGSIG